MLLHKKCNLTVTETCYSLRSLWEEAYRPEAEHTQGANMLKLTVNADKSKLSALEKVLIKKLQNSQKSLWMLEQTVR